MSSMLGTVMMSWDETPGTPALDLKCMMPARKLKPTGLNAGLRERNSWTYSLLTLSKSCRFNLSATYDQASFL